ncbi:hypothetical protein [Pseudoxanthomonas winnipegensis]|uniref:Uncharacterized protein n=1 Tax=Pseudoxanthomonas winnipegensis TaxID=2480810 RepID=A0A4Q8LCX3_9GAMM|nr:hypothetical protein [Pseudoxanthomonas winnipegensis]TAA26551.1 hypothetical protein EA660_04780 [Pseudoxanthomonas winnipegensis]
MSHDTQGAPAPNGARHIAFIFGQIADTLDWTHEAWQALIARLTAGGQAATDLTLGEILNAITATITEQAGGGA